MRNVGNARPTHRRRTTKATGGPVAVLSAVAIAMALSSCVRSPDGVESLGAVASPLSAIPLPGRQSTASSKTVIPVAADGPFRGAFAWGSQVTSNLVAGALDALAAAGEQGHAAAACECSGEGDEGLTRWFACIDEDRDALIENDLAFVFAAALLLAEWDNEDAPDGSGAESSR